MSQGINHNPLNTFELENAADFDVDPWSLPEYDLSMDLCLDTAPDLEVNLLGLREEANFEFHQPSFTEQPLEAFMGNVYEGIGEVPDQVSYNDPWPCYPPGPNVDVLAPMPTGSWSSGAGPSIPSCGQGPAWSGAAESTYSGAIWPAAELTSNSVNDPISPQLSFSATGPAPTASPMSTSGTSTGSSTPESEQLSNSSAASPPCESDGPTEDVTDQTPWKCTYCSECFTKRPQLSIHLKKHTLVCPVTGCPRPKGFATDRDRNRHLRANHKDYSREHNIPSKDKQCGVPGCGKVCRADNLKRHMKMVHNKVVEGRVSKGSRRGKVPRGF